MYREKKSRVIVVRSENDEKVAAWTDRRLSGTSGTDDDDSRWLDRRAPRTR